MRSLWNVHGTGESSPFHCRGSPDAVTSGDILPVWIDRPSSADQRRQVQRGCPLGISFSSPCQILSLLTAASTIPTVKVQWCRNEGNVLLRATCSALKAVASESKPSAKLTSPVSSDSDIEAFGTFGAKLKQARLQQIAWRNNNELLFELVRFSFGVGSARESGGIKQFKKTVDALKSKSKLGGGLLSEEEIISRELFVKAAL